MPLAITYATYGDASVLELTDIAMPVTGAGQVRLRVLAAAVNPIDWKLRSGLYAGGQALAERTVPGFDVAGVVDAIGDGVDSVDVGDRVVGSATGGSYAEYALARASDLTALPDGLEPEVAAGIPMAGKTAFRVLRQLNLQPGQLLLIHGAAGGVGIFATQLGLSWGAEVIGTAGAANQDFLRSLGATAVEYGDGWENRVRTAAGARHAASDGTDNRPLDAVFDASGAGVLAGSLGLLREGGKIITIADPTAAEHGVEMSSGDDPAEALGQVVEAVASGKISVPIERMFPLAEASEAHRLSEAGHVRGKIVLTMS